MKRILFLVSIVALASTSKAESANPAAKRDPHIPAEKNLDPAWVASLFERGERKVYQGEELTYIGMPCGGIGAGQVEVTGEGTLRFYCSTFDRFQDPNAGHGLSTGYQYLNPQKPESGIKTGFSITIGQQGQPDVSYGLSDQGFDDIRFIGEYPVAQLEYLKSDNSIPV